MTAAAICYARMRERVAGALLRRAKDMRVQQQIHDAMRAARDDVCCLCRVAR